MICLHSAIRINTYSIFARCGIYMHDMYVYICTICMYVYIYISRLTHSSLSSLPLPHKSKHWIFQLERRENVQVPVKHGGWRSWTKHFQRSIVKLEIRSTTTKRGMAQTGFELCTLRGRTKEFDIFSLSPLCRLQEMHWYCNSFSECTFIAT